MAFTAVGTWRGGSTGSISLSNQAVGNLLIVEVHAPLTATVWPTALSAGGATWALAGVKFSGTTNSCSAAVFFGRVTATGTQTATITWSGSTPGQIHYAGQEFHSTIGGWLLDKQGNLDIAGTAAWPTLTPAVSGEIYFGYAYNSFTATVGTTSGYTWNASADGQGDGAAYNPACGAGATFPDWGDSTEIFGIMVLVRENVALPATFAVSAAFPAPTVSTSGGSALAFPATLVVSAAFPACTVIAISDVTILTDEAVSYLLAENSVALNTEAGTVSTPVTPAALTVSTAFPACTVRQDQTVTPITLAVSTAFPACTVRQDQTVTPITLAVSTAFPACTVRQDQTVTPITLAVSTAFPVHTVAGGANPLPATLTVTASLPVPAVATASSATAIPITLAVSTAFPACMVSISVLAAVGQVAASVSFPGTSLGYANATVIPATVTASVSFFTTTVSVPLVTSPVLEAYGFGPFTGVPAGSGIVTVIATIGQYGSSPGIAGPLYQLWDGTSAQIGATQAGQPSQYYENADEVSFAGVTQAQLPTLRLRIIAQAQTGNSGATESAGWVALTVGYTPSLSAAVAPVTLAPVAQFYVMTVTAITNAAAAVASLTASSSFPVPSVGHLFASPQPSALNGVASFPAAVASTAPGVIAALAVWASFPVAVVAVASAMGYASSERVIDGGSGSWVNEANIDGPPDGSEATWTVP